MKVCLGGTFNVLHLGHKKLIDKALELAGENGLLFVGVAKGKMIDHKKDVKKFEYRKQQIISYVKSKKILDNILIKPIYDKYGPTIDEDFDFIVVSPETKSVALEINEKRKKNGKKSIQIITIPYVLADDKKPISSTRILNNEIDEKGNIVN